MHMTINNQSKVGVIKEEVLNLCTSGKLTLTLNQPIFISDGNEDHIKKNHPIEYEKYFSKLGDIIDNPDYLGIHPSGGSIQYFKLLGDGPDRVLVAVRATNGGKLFVRSLYSVTEEKFNSYLKSGTLKKVK